MIFVQWNLSILLNHVVWQRQEHLLNYRQVFISHLCLIPWMQSGFTVLILIVIQGTGLFFPLPASVWSHGFVWKRKHGRTMIKVWYVKTCFKMLDSFLYTTGLEYISGCDFICRSDISFSASEQQWLLVLSCVNASWATATRCVMASQ